MLDSAVLYNESKIDSLILVENIHCAWLFHGPHILNKSVEQNTAEAKNSEG